MAKRSFDLERISAMEVSMAFGAAMEVEDLAYYISYTIFSLRKAKRLTQSKLAELSKCPINMIQRIENPRTASTVSFVTIRHISQVLGHKFCIKVSLDNKSANVKTIEI